MALKILVVDDEKDIVEFIQYNLEKEGFEVITAHNGNEALEAIKEKPDLVVLDVMMPGIDGYEVCEKIRLEDKYKSIPILLLTAKTREQDEIRGLELGADDYITKPVSIQKLIARIKSNIRQSESNITEISNGIIEVGPIKIDREAYIVYLNAEKIVFPRKEFEIIYYLANKPGKVIPREQLLSSIWGDDVFVGDRTIDVHVRKIREKLDKYSNLIETVKGVGYRFKSQ
ncbi:MAG: DNA-binding response regulator [Ignavibacteriales bacterium CG18_big_fil_WC_8_21_14_2_50_31_20]|nr:MAG: DNA-binding response regulator [Ignavibacteriales bacterium CG18_big_fil_WC_8_21_14_2_50_31_20]